MPWCPECGAEYRDGFARCSECGVELAPAAPPASEHAAAPGPEWVAAASYRTVEEARLAAGLLEQNGIAAAVVDRHVVLNPFPQVDEAAVLVLVSPGDAAPARAVLARVASGDDTLPEDAEPDLPEGKPR